MFDSELNSFLSKFHQLRKSGATAHLDVDTHAGQAWVGLRVMLGPIQHQPSSSQRQRSPSYFRRQERRRAAKQSSEESDKIVTEEVAEKEKETEAVEAVTKENAAEATNAKVDYDFECELCDFKSTRRTGVQVHMSRKHAQIEQLDGNTTLPENVIEDKFEEDVEYYLQSGYMRDPHYVGPRGMKLWLFIQHEIIKCKPELSYEEKYEEYELMRKLNHGPF